ncbi:sugar phosphate isomerase/epimerase family protein [Candidatus Poriferisodalis sp.]|uniref:sugar phosphate isomerase/epimerase family protein n=1 Tax=Candidatus Poriferisodalis sp. TaxID=3101277 RepID=UPI003B02439C
MSDNARSLGPNDLVWDHFSRPRFDDVPARIRAAADAGFAAVGLYLGAWERLRADAAEVQRIERALAETGLVIANIEVVRGWASPHRADTACTRQEALAYEIADRFGCRYLQAIGSYSGAIAQAAEGFAALCDRAADHGLLVGLEWVPSLTNIPTAAVAREIVSEADHPSGGYCFDSWHLTRSTNDLDDLRCLNGSKIFATQFNDGPVAPAHPDYLHDCLTNRVPPGHGEFALVEMVRVLDELGSTAPIGLEVCSAQLWADDVAFAAQAAADGMRAVLRQARRR